jgi:DNA sulfur modification protein DndE
VFFGNNFDLYVGMVCMKYRIHSSDNDILKYIKMHVDDGLESLNEFVEDQGISDSLQFLNKLIKV